MTSGGAEKMVSDHLARATSKPVGWSFRARSAVNNHDEFQSVILFVASSSTPFALGSNKHFSRNG